MITMKKVYSPKYTGFQNFSLFAKKFSIYNCSLPRLDVPTYRDTEI